LFQKYTFEGGKEVGDNNNFSWVTVVLLAVFCIGGSFGGGLSIKTMTEHHGAAALAGYGVAGGIFIAISVVLLRQILAYLQDK
jgi:hypothetical protein